MATKKKAAPEKKEVVKEFKPYDVIVNVTALNIRSAPDKDAQVIGVLGKNQRVSIIGGDKEWGQIKEGYILLKFTVKF